MMNHQEIFVKTNEMDLEAIQDSLEENLRRTRHEAFLIESVIGVNQNLPSEGFSTPLYSGSRRGSFTLEEEVPRNQTRKYSFEMIDTYFKENQPTKNQTTPLKETMNLEFALQEPKMIQRARSHSLASIDGSISEETFLRPHHSLADCIQVGSSGSKQVEPQATRVAKTSQSDHPASKLATEAPSFKLKLISKSKNQLSEESNGIALDQLLQVVTPVEQSPILIDETMGSPLECFDFEEQLSLANANIPEGKNGKILSNFSLEKHLDLRQKHDLQPDRVGACLQNYLCRLRVRGTEQRSGHRS